MMERRLAEEMQGGKKRKPRAGAEGRLASPHLLLFYTVLVQTVHSLLVLLAGKRVPTFSLCI